MWFFGSKGAFGFSSRSTAEEVTHGVDGTGLTAIVTGFCSIASSLRTFMRFHKSGLSKKKCSVSDYQGASSGIGVETERVLSLRGLQVVMAVRNTGSGAKVKEDIVNQVPGAKVDIMESDLSSMESVRKFASEYKSTRLPLNLLMRVIEILRNNAGIMACPFMLSKDNIELQFATNHLGDFLLTKLLLEIMKNTSRERKREGRIVNLSSEAHRFSYPEGVRFDKINDKSSYSSFRAYGQSKLWNILHANELAKQLKEDGVNITANSIHSGAIMTNLGLYFNSFLAGAVGAVAKYMLKTVPQGAATTCCVALHPQVAGVTGEYFSDSNIAKPLPLAKDSELAKKVWDFSTKLYRFAIRRN